MPCSLCCCADAPWRDAQRTFVDRGVFVDRRAAAGVLHAMPWRAPAGMRTYHVPVRNLQLYRV